ncbi:MAG: hypothetical protein ABW252_15580 [Polyangiales bacterium]
MLLLGISYLLLTAAPAVSQQLRGVVGSGGSGGAVALWALTLAAVGLLVGGGAALMFVLVQLAADVRRRPYAYLAPALAAFSACILVGLDARLPLTGISAEHVAVFALVVSVVGGALMQDPRAPLQFTGLLLTLWPPVCLLLMVWAAGGKGNPAAGVERLGPAALGYLSILTISSLAIAALALVVRSSEAAERRGGASESSGAQMSSESRQLEEMLSGAFTTAATGLRRGIVALHKPLLAAFGIALAVGVVRAIVGASGTPEPLMPALVEPVGAPVVSPMLAPWVEPTAPTVTATVTSTPVTQPSAAPAPALVGERVSERATVREAARDDDRSERARSRSSRHRSRRSARTKVDAAPAVAPKAAPAPSRNTIIDASAWGAEEVAAAPARAQAVSKPLAAATRTRVAPVREPEPPPQPKPAARESADPGLDALIKDVLGSTK